MIKHYLAKYFTNLVSILTLFGLSYFTYDLYQTKQRERRERLALEERYGRLVGTTEAFKTLSDEKSQLAVAYKSQLDLANKAIKAFENLVVEREERIKSLTQTIISVEQKISKQLGPDYIYETEERTSGFIINELRIEGDDSPPIGYVLIKKDGETIKRNYDFEIVIDSVQMKDDYSGKIRVVSKAYLVAQENGLAEKRRPDLKKWVGERYPLSVTGGEVLVDPIEPIFPPDTAPGFIWGTFNLNGGFGIFSEQEQISARPMLDLNLAGYGVSKRDLSWKFGHVGMNYSESGGLGFHLMPFSYRPMPSVLTNSYTGLGWYGDRLRTGYFLGINIGF